MSSKKIIYISSGILYATEIQKSSKGVKVLKDIRIPIDKETFFNGQILNENKFAEVLGKLKAIDKTFTKELIVIADNNSIINKMVEVPSKIRESALQNIAKKELVYSQDSDLLFDSRLITKKNKEKYAYCTAIDKKVVKGYSNAFSSVGFTIKTVDIPLTTIIDYVLETKEYKDEDSLVAVVNGNILYIVLFQEGHYVFSVREKIYAEPGTLEYRNFIFNKLDVVISYYKSTLKKSEESLKHLLIYGVTQEDLDFLNELTDTTKKLEFLVMKTIVDKKRKELNLAPLGISDEEREKIYVSDLPFYILAYGDVINLNLYLSIQKATGYVLTKSQKQLLIGLPILSLIVAGVIIGMPIYKTNQIKAQTKEINNVLKSADYIKSYNDSVGTYELYRELTQKKSNIENFESQIKLQSVKTTIINQVIKVTDVDGLKINMLSYSTSTDIINITGTANTEVGPANLVKTLKDLECFSNIVYTSRRLSQGYSFTLTLYIGTGASDVKDKNEWAWEDNYTQKFYDSVDVNRPIDMESKIIEGEPDNGEVFTVILPDGNEFSIASQEDVNYIRSILPTFDFGDILERGGYY